MNWLNIPNATRNLSDEQFAELLPQFAKELAAIDYHYNYSEEELRQDWEKLKKYNRTDVITAAQTRPGMKLCEHFFPNFFKICSPKGLCFQQFWNPQDLQKVIKWNRSSHSTPYLSEMRRGINFCYGLTKNTMYRPHLAKTICKYYNTKVLLDPCCGWGGRLLGAIAAGAKYIGFEPNTETYQNLLTLINFLQINDKVIIYNCPVEDYDLSLLEYDTVLTSPPYYNLEIYCDEDTQSENRFSSYQDWFENWMKPVIDKTSLKAKQICWNVADVGKIKLLTDLTNYMSTKSEWQESQLFGIGSSARQANQNELKNKKNLDKTITYIRI